MTRVLWQGCIIALLTLVTQIGGLAWLASLGLARSKSTVTLLAIFLALYTALWASARAIASAFGRTAIPCTDQGPKRAVALSPIFCALNRTYVSPELANQLNALAGHMSARFPGTRTYVLDAGFPFFDGFPLMPHLSHDDGQKADLSFWYEGNSPRSPIGYGAFEEPRSGDPQPCKDVTGLTLRWNLTWLQPLMRQATLDETRTAEGLRWLATNLPAGSKVFVEPHLTKRLSINGEKIRFQGCRAARHDDHIHVQL